MKKPLTVNPHRSPVTSSLVSIADEALPRILGSKTVVAKVKEEMKLHHRWRANFYISWNKMPILLTKRYQ